MRLKKTDRGLRRGGRVAKPLADRFESHIERTDSGCWLWRGALLGGYGYICGGPNRGRKSMRVHRVSWILYRGEIPEGLCVCHKCDVRSCVNPDHLFLGTNNENMHDAFVKGRFAHGERAHKAKLTEDAVRYIRSRVKRYGLNVELARKFGVKKDCIWKIRAGWSWKHAS